ncbi:MAG: helix-turn-helix domain-containing protein [Planctomycetaceae bacterium]|nr:helix-turn-helix domain-containing protein [Planctomycetaceae bacterium]MCB9950084.1 helix-turn-helix domain-containing protein [Planctomycetaceae bacterium]
MAKIFHPLLALIASLTDSELARYVQFLKEENKILRSRVKGHIHTKPEERSRLLELGKELGRAIEELITIVSPKTFYRWIREREGRKRKLNPKGGQRKPKELRELVIQIAQTTGFGYTRILGELRKLGIKKISRQTIRNILKEEGIAPGAGPHFGLIQFRTPNLAPLTATSRLAGTTCYINGPSSQTDAIRQVV